MTLRQRGATDAIVGDVDHCKGSQPPYFDGCGMRLAVLFHVGKGFGYHEVSRILRRIGELYLIDLHRGGDSAAGSQRGDRCGQALLGQDRRSNASGEGTDLGQCVL